MSEVSFDELVADLRIAVFGNAARAAEALEWQIGHSRVNDLRAIGCFELHYDEWMRRDGSRDVRFQIEPLLSALCNSPHCDVWDILKLYRWLLRKPEWFKLAQGVERACFGLSYYRDESRENQTEFLNRFSRLPRLTQLNLVASLLAEDARKHSVMVCGLAPRIDWGALHRLTPSPLSYWGLNNFRQDFDDVHRPEPRYELLADSLVDQWHALLDTLVEVEKLELDTKVFAA